MEALQCPRCNGKYSKVLETRKATILGQQIIVRIRLCRHCDEQYRTKEIVDHEIDETFRQGRKKKIEIPSPPIDPPPSSPENPFFQ